MIQESLYPSPEAGATPPAPRNATARHGPALRDPEREFFHNAASFLWWTWRLVHRAGSPFGPTEILERRRARAEQLEMLIAEMRSFKRMTKDPNEYRAIFRGPRLAAHQMQVKIAADIEIKAYQATADRWEAWYWNATDRRATAPLMTPEGHRVTAGSLAKVKEIARAQFETVVRTWQAYNPATGEPAPKPAQTAAADPEPAA